MMRAVWDSFRLALGTFVANPLRTLLTLLGIVIGVATVVAVMALIEGLHLKVRHDLSGLGAGVFQVSKFPPGVSLNVDWRKFEGRRNLTLADSQAIARGCPSVRAASVETQEPGQRVSAGVRETPPSVTVSGVTADHQETAGLEVDRGRFFSSADEVAGRSVTVIGATVASKLFADQNPIGKDLRLRNRPFRVIGTLERRGSLLGMTDLDNVVLIPLEPFSRLYGANRSLDINVLPLEVESLARAQDEVIVMLRERRRVRAQDPEDFELGTNESMTESFNRLSSAMSTAGFGICVLSLLVGGIGILNIMLVSVTERTREIGLRKALGAKRARILAQFTLEALLLSLAGCGVGLLLGYAAAFVAQWAFGQRAVVPLWSVLLSVGVSALVGLLFGIYPAVRASRLSPVEAMRTD